MILQRTSGLDGDGHLAVDLPESRTVQRGDESGGTDPLRGKKLSPGQRGTSCNQTEISRTEIIFVRMLNIGKSIESLSDCVKMHFIP